MEQRGFIVIADITGYTTYLNDSELEHAQGTLTDLLELLIDHTKSPLIISRLEGDAVISYGFEAGFVSGQTLLEIIERTYVDFRKAIELMVLNNTCQCNACANVAALDLKFFVHFGTFVLQQIGDHDELLGTDVNLIHRLLKNSVTADTGIRAYLLCTDAALEALNMQGPGTMVPHTEAVADLGEVSVWIVDMGPAYEAAAADRIEFAPGEVIAAMEVETVLPPHIVWDYLSDPEYRKVLLGSDRQEILDRKAGRIAPGSSFQCFHGKKVYSQVILEWKPFERFALEQLLLVPGGPATMVVDHQLTPVDDGTLLALTAGRMSGKGIRRAVWRAMIRLTAGRVQRGLDRFRDEIESDYRARAAAGSPRLFDVGSIAGSAETAVAEWNAGPPENRSPRVPEPPAG